MFLFNWVIPRFQPLIFQGVRPGKDEKKREKCSAIYGTDGEYRPNLYDTVCEIRILS